MSETMHGVNDIRKYDRAGQATDGNIIQRMRIACLIPKASDTNLGFVIFIASPRQQWLCERASMLCYMHIAYLVI
jgi:hypothetical protein